MIVIKRCLTEQILGTYDCETAAQAVALAVKNMADLSGANLSSADLYGADLSGANLSGANLYRANLSGSLNCEYELARTSIVPEEGSFVGYKKLANGTIAKLLIPEEQSV